MQNGNAALTKESGCKTLEKSYPEILPDQPKSESSKVHLYIPLKCFGPQCNVIVLFLQTYPRSTFPRLIYQIKILLVTCLLRMLLIVKN